MITHHTDLLNALAKKINAERYLEIGLQNRQNNFDKIKVKYKISVDPDPNAQADFICTSDEYFKEYGEVKYDLVFIDGMHSAEQVKKDFENSLRCLNDNGFIVIHDCLPENEETTHVPRDSRVWHGDVYKFCMNIGRYANIGYKTFNIDNGCMLVWKERNDFGGSLIPDDYNHYKWFKKQAMNITDEVII